MTALTRAAFLVALPLGAAWYLWHGHRFVAAALMAAAFAFIIGTKIRSDVRRKQEEENLQEQAKSDGRYVAAHIEGLSQTQTPTAAELPAKSVAHLEEMWAQITRGLKR
jgi:GTP cyclohydrolase III